MGWGQTFPSYDFPARPPPRRDIVSIFARPLPAAGALGTGWRRWMCRVQRVARRLSHDGLGTRMVDKAAHDCCKAQCRQTSHATCPNAK